MNPELKYKLQLKYIDKIYNCKLKLNNIASMIEESKTTKKRLDYLKEEYDQVKKEFIELLKEKEEINNS